jgi:hypothetical protein
MDDYRFFVRAAKPLLKAAQKEAAEPTVSRLQAMFLGMTLPSNPMAATPLLAEKIFARSRVATPVAQMFERGVKNPALPTITAGTFGQMFSRGTNQQQ